MKKIILLSILFIVGCEKYSPTDHTHDTTGICVQTPKTISDSELNEYGCIEELSNFGFKSTITNNDLRQSYRNFSKKYIL